MHRTAWTCVTVEATNTRPGIPYAWLSSCPADEVTPDRRDPIQYPTCVDYIIPASVVNTVGVVRIDSSP
jgi:hypothetical protein